MKLSVVSTMYQSSPFLSEFCLRISQAAEQFGDSYELILVNDGSPDNSLETALELQTKNTNIKIIDLSRNFGHHAAIMAGIDYAKGDYVFLIDCDLEEQPEWLTLFKQEMVASKADVVFGAQHHRVASPTSNFLGSLFWKVLNIASKVHIPHNPMSCRLMKRNYVNAVIAVRDKVLYLAGVFAWTGFKQQPLYLTKTPRSSNHLSTYSFSKRLLQVLDSFSSFSVAPLYLVFFLGSAIWMTSIVYGLYLLFRKIIDPSAVMTGFTSMMLSIWFLSGAIIIALGIIGLYISKIFQEVKDRPLYITKKIYGEPND